MTKVWIYSTMQYNYERRRRSVLVYLQKHCKCVRNFVHRFDASTWIITNKNMNILACFESDILISWYKFQGLHLILYLAMYELPLLIKLNKKCTKSKQPLFATYMLICEKSMMFFVHHFLYRFVALVFLKNGHFFKNFGHVWLKVNFRN